MKKSATTNKRSKRGVGSGGAGEGGAQSPGKGKTGGSRPAPGLPGENRGGRSGGAEPISRDEEVQENNDEHIDQDFPGYPHHPSRNAHGRTIHNGSAGAFDATEHSHDEDDEDQDSDDFAIGR